jgi:hypothetical protein
MMKGEEKVYVVKSSHRLLDGSVLVEAMALKDVDIVKAKTLEGLVDRVEDVLAGETTTVDVALRLLRRRRSDRR